MLGAETNAQLSQSLHFSKDKAAQARLEMIGQRVTQVSDRQDYQYHFFLVDKDEMNAFTVPGGYIYFYTGLYKKLKTDDQIAAVLAHETGHCSARHVVKRFQAALGYDFIGSLIFSQIQDAFAVRLARMGSDTIMSVAMASYSRDDEYEADRLGVKYMYLAGYDPEGMVQTFEVLGQASKGDDKGWLLLRSHPELGDRIEAVKKEIAEVKNKY
jgi:predicted Zn-dependent protease